MPLVTTEEFDAERLLRIESDSLLARWTGTAFNNTTKAIVDQYPSYSPVVDLVNGESLLTALKRLDTSKNSKIFIYSPSGSLIVSNVRSMYFSGLVSVTDLGSNQVRIRTPLFVTWDTGTFYVVPQGELPTNYFGTGIIVERSAIWIIAAQLSVISNVKLIGRRAALSF